MIHLVTLVQNLLMVLWVYIRIVNKYQIMVHLKKIFIIENDSFGYTLLEFNKNDSLNISKFSYINNSVVSHCIPLLKFLYFSILTHIPIVD